MDSKTLIRFENEARILASLNHPNIVNIYTLGDYLGMKYLAMEYVEGVTLGTVIDKKSFGVADSIKVIKQVLHGLFEAHEKGILHRDIKPANLLIDSKNQVKIVDFGISKNLVDDDPKLTQENHFIGTINYMAPELLKGRNPSPASDIFSTGVVFYELLTGRNPFPTGNKFATIDKIRNEQVILPHELSQTLPQDLIAVINKMLANNIEDRYLSAKEAFEDLDKVKEALLPAFHGVSIRPTLVVVNKEQLRLKLLQKGFQNHELDIILKMATNLEEMNQSLAVMPQTEATIDLSTEKHTGSIRVSPENFEMAINNYVNSVNQSKTTSQHSRDTSQTKTGIITQSGRHTLNTKSTNQYRSYQTGDIPFPLFRPSFILKSMAVIGLLAANFYIYKIFFNKDENSEQSNYIEYVLNFFNQEQDATKESTQKEESKTKPQNFTDNLIKDLERNLSSIPAGEKKNLPPGSSFKVRIKKINRRSGTILLDQINTVKIRKITKENQMYANILDGNTGRWSSQQLDANALVPPIRWYRKNAFNYKNIVDGNPDDIYPIHLGKKTQFNYQTLSQDGTFKQHNKNCHVASSVKTKAFDKNFDAFEIFCLTKSEEGKTATTLVYSPIHNIVLKSTSTTETPDGDIEESMEMIELNLGNNQ